MVTMMPRSVWYNILKPMKSSKPAQGQRGMLIRGMDGQIWFRQYDADHDFIDYDITHYDCEIEIVDSSAELIRNERGDFLDYTKESMGIEK
jgi:hypothetical protein